MTRLAAALPLICSSLASAAEPPVLGVESAFVDVQDGDAQFEGEWIVGEGTAEHPQTYIPLRSDQPKSVCFRSGREQRCFDTVPGGTTEFIIAFDERLVFTRIDRAKQGPATLRNDVHATHSGQAPLRVPFTLDPDRGILLQGALNGVPVTLALDTGAKVVSVVGPRVEGRVPLTFDGEVTDLGPAGIQRAKSSSGNRLTVGDLTWDALEVVNSPFGETDVIAGWSLFETQLVELDADRHELVVHESLDTLPPGFVRRPMRVINGSPYIEATLTVRGRRFTEWFLVGSSFNDTLHLSARTMVAHHLTPDDHVRGALVSASGSPISLDRLELDTVELGGFTFETVQATATAVGAKEIPHDDLLGNELLRAFNLVLDVKRHQLFLKPNASFEAVAHPFRFHRASAAGIAGLGVALAALASWWRLRRRARRPG